MAEIKMQIYAYDPKTNCPIVQYTSTIYFFNTILLKGWSSLETNKETNEQIKER